VTNQKPQTTGWPDSHPCQFSTKQVERDKAALGTLTPTEREARDVYSRAEMQAAVQRQKTLDAAPKPVDNATVLAADADYEAAMGRAEDALKLATSSRGSGG
jgi:hypothetical protein